MDPFSFRLFSTFFLTLGLLKFGFDAPGILKNIIGSMDDAIKGKFNGLSAFNEMTSNAKKTVDSAKKYGTMAGKTVAAPFVGGYKVGKGVYKAGKGVGKVGGAVGGGVSGLIQGGKEGGYIVCEGTPETIAACKESYTGKYLAQVIKNNL